MNRVAMFKTKGENEKSKRGPMAKLQHPFQKLYTRKTGSVSLVTSHEVSLPSTNSNVGA